MTFIPKPKEPDPKPRLVLVTDPGEIAAIQRSSLTDPRGFPHPSGQWYAEAESLRQYRDPAAFLEQTPDHARKVHERADDVDGSK